MAEKLQTGCVIAGGGPAGIMTGYLLARAGVPVIVLEKHADFFRDFRGDTIHPSTLELMYELGLLDEFLKQPHQEVQELRLSSMVRLCRLPTSRSYPRAANSSLSCRSGIFLISFP